MLPAWERIQNELMDTSTIHATFASKMLDDIEKSLRSIIVADQAYAEIRSVGYFVNAFSTFIDPCAF